MNRRILIVDDHDDLRSELSDVFAKMGCQVSSTESRLAAVALGNLETFDVVITDLDDCCEDPALSLNGDAPSCLPTPHPDGETIKAFKISAANFRRDEFNEEELSSIFDAVLDFKAKHVDTPDVVKRLHEKIEFEFPSTIALMHTVLNYLMSRIEKTGVVKAENSNLFIALDEAFVNAVKHGNKYNLEKIVKITADVSTKEAIFSVEDEGDGFDVNAIPDPLDPENLFKTSGRGVLIIHNVMDEVSYNQRGNRVTMIKKSEQPSQDPN